MQVDKLKAPTGLSFSIGISQFNVLVEECSEIQLSEQMKEGL
ncbi:hypothetical protein [Lacrimispora sp.]|nr:hypothetical protein [Lacrimispora sp.]